MPSGLSCAPRMAHPYPYEKLGDESKQILVGAQREAELSGKAFIGTEHLLLAMLRLQSSTAYRILTKFDLTYENVARKIAAGPTHDGRRRGQQVIPTSRVKRVIELAFGEADAMNHNMVDSAHVLTGLVLEGEGIAALVLQDLGATAERVIAEVEREVDVPLSGRGKLPISRPRGSGNLPEPPNIVGLRDKLVSIRFALKHAVDGQDTEHALKLGREENRLERELERATKRWLDSPG